MVPRLRLVALLMLLAGASLGVFATKALSTLRFRDAPPTPASSPLIEERVRLYRRIFRLEEARADQVRQELIQFDRRVMDKMWELRRQNTEWFTNEAKETDARILRILEAAGP